MRPPRLGTLFALAACLMLVLPASAVSIPQIGQKDNGFSITDEVYLRTYEKCWDALKADCGRNLVDDGLSSGEAPSEARVERSTATMQRWLAPPQVEEPAAVVSPDVVAPAPATSVPTTSVASSTVQCESGGDYSINTGNGYYGGYQFDSQTWDAYGDSAYGEANEAPPSVQDAAAASVPYDAWPNC